MLFCLPYERRKLGMLLALLLGVTVTTSRAVGLVLDADVTPPLLRALFVEIALTIAPLVIYLRMPRSGSGERAV
jgi:hypothetical protein